MTQRTKARVAIISRESDSRTLDIAMLEAELRKRGINVKVLSKLLTKFTAAGVNIEYMYAFLDVKRVGQACMIFRVSDTEASERALVNAGLMPLTQEDFADL